METGSVTVRSHTVRRVEAQQARMITFIIIIIITLLLLLLLPVLLLLLFQACTLHSCS